MVAVVADGVRKIVRWRGNTKYVDFEDTRLEQAVERVLAEEPPGEAGPCLDWPAGNYLVRSRTAALVGEHAFWHIRLDTETGRFIGPHNCEGRAAAGRRGEHVTCRHIALAWLCWKAERDNANPFLRRIAESEALGEWTVPETAVSEDRALQPYQEQQVVALQPYMPSEQEIAGALALATTLESTRGAAIPSGLDTKEKIAAVVLSSRALGIDPMLGLQRLYIVNGRTQPDGQMCESLLRSAGFDIDWLEMSNDGAKATLIPPAGRRPLTMEFTMADATRAGLTNPQPAPLWVDATDQDGKKLWDSERKRYKRVQQGTKETNPWLLYPRDMLMWKVLERLARFGGAHVLNAMDASAVKLTDIEDYTHRVQLRLESPPQPPPAGHDAAPADDIHEADYTMEEDLRDAQPSATADTTPANTTSAQAAPSTWAPAPSGSGRPGPASSSAASAATSAPSTTAPRTEPTPSAESSPDTTTPLAFCKAPELAWLGAEVLRLTGTPITFSGRAKDAGEQWLANRLGRSLEDVQAMTVGAIARVLGGGPEDDEPGELRQPELMS